MMVNDYHTKCAATNVDLILNKGAGTPDAGHVPAIFALIGFHPRGFPLGATGD